MGQGENATCAVPVSNGQAQEFEHIFLEHFTGQHLLETAAPVDGAANLALLRLVADELGVARRDVTLVAGAGGRTKLVAVAGLDPARLLERWPGLGG